MRRKVDGMSSYLKRYWWVINIVLLTVLAWLCARVVNNVIAAEIAALPTKPAKVTTPKSDKRENRKIAKTFAEKISDRNLFNSTPPSDDISDTTDDHSGRPEGNLPGEYDECTESKRPYTLVATMVVQPASESFAIFRVNGYNQIARVGENIGEISLAAVYRERAVFIDNNSYECAALGAQKRGGDTKPSRTPAKDSSQPAKGKDTANEALVKAGIRDLGENRKEVDRTMLDEQLADLTRLSKEARVVADYDTSGKQRGFKVTRVTEGSLYSALGLKRGDVLTGVNGESLDSANKALKLFDTLSTAKNITIQGERKGKPIEMEFIIR